MIKKLRKQSSLDTWLRNGQHPRDERESSRVPDWFLNSNIRKLVRKYIRKGFDIDSWSNQHLIDKVTWKFYKKYTDYPTSRRSPLLNLDKLILMPSLETPDMNPICFMNQILMECFVDMSKNNFYLKCELKAYELIMRQQERVRYGSDFPTFEDLKAKTIHVYQKNHVAHKQPPMRSENESGMAKIAASSHERETQQKLPSRKRPTAAPLSVLEAREKRKKMRKEAEDTMDKGVRNFFDENYEFSPEDLKKLRREFRELRKAGRAAASKPRRRIRENPPDSATEDARRCDEGPQQISMDKSSPKKKKHRIVDSPTIESHGQKSIRDEQQFRSPDLDLRKMKNATEASTSTPTKSPIMRLLAAASATFSPKVTNNKSSKRVSFESPGKQFDASQVSVVPKRCKKASKTPLAPETSATGEMDSETPSWLKRYWDFENQVTSTPLAQETSEMDSEGPSWLKRFWGENGDYDNQVTSNCCHVRCETENLSEELIAAVISTPAVGPDDFIIELPDDSEVAVRGHSAIEERLIGGIIEVMIEFPCDTMAESTAVETEEKSNDEEMLENPPIIQETQAEEDVPVTQDILTTQVSNSELCGTVEDDEVTVSTDSYQSVESIWSEREFCTDVVIDKLAAEEIAKDLEISTDKMSENEIVEVALPLLTCLYHHLPDDDVVFVGEVEQAVVFVEDLTQTINITQLSQDPLMQEMSEIFGF